MFIKLIFFLVLMPSAAYCCSVDKASFDQSTLNPKTAKTIMLGTITRNSLEYYFTSKDLWKHIKIPIQRGGCLGYNGFSDGEVVVFSSDKSVGDLIKNKYEINPTRGRFTRLINTSKFLEYIIEQEEFPLGHMNLFWGYCDNDSDCKSVVGRCGEKIGLNIINQSKFESYLKKNKKYKCSESNNRKISICIKNFCS